MSDLYDKPPELYDGIRLHQNENTGGCSPRVLEALAAIGPGDVCVYPPYSALIDELAAHVGVPADWIALVNGLDEGILGMALAYVRPKAGQPVPEAIVPEPAFDIFAYDVDLVGGRTVEVPPGDTFAFQLDAVLAAITPRTRLVFLTHPNNPTGQSLPHEAFRAIARRVPPGAIVFVDEAYWEFSGDSFLSELPAHPNVIVGRTFSKAYGLAALRIGCLIGRPDVLAPIVKVVPVYSVNVAAVFALRAALEDQDYVRHYLREVDESKRLLYAACDRLGLEYWPSAANFVLVKVGDRVPAVMEGLVARGFYIRDRSREPGCAGCVRITTGVVAHTKGCIDALEAVLCAAR